MREPSTDPNKAGTETPSEGSSPPAAPHGHEYEVGYGKPPIGTRYKTGQCGNLKGRPPKQRNFHTLVKEAFAALVVVREGGKTRKIPVLHALILRTLDRALKGDDKATMTALRMAQALDPPPTAEATEHELSPAEQRIFDQIIGERGKDGGQQ
jgi:hypothetical protein